MLRIILIIMGVLLSVGCATPYQSGALSFTGGHNAVTGPGKLVRIDFAGNGFIDNETAEIYAYYRCAEYTKEQGKNFFLLYGSLTDAAKDKRGNKVSLGLVGSKPVAYAYILLRDEPESLYKYPESIIKKNHFLVYPTKKRKIDS